MHLPSHFLSYQNFTLFLSSWSPSTAPFPSISHSTRLATLSDIYANISTSLPDVELRDPLPAHIIHGARNAAAADAVCQEGYVPRCCTFKWMGREGAVAGGGGRGGGGGPGMKEDCTDIMAWKGQRRQGLVVEDLGTCIDGGERGEVLLSPGGEIVDQVGGVSMVCCGALQLRHDGTDLYCFLRPDEEDGISDHGRRRGGEL